MVGAEVLEDQEEGDQGWSALAIVALLFVLPFAAFALLSTIRAGIEWFFAARAR